METDRRDEQPSIMPARIDWPSAVGNFILNFGTLEMLLFSFLEKHLSSGEFEKCRKLHFKDRMEAVAGCFTMPEFTSVDRDSFTQLPIDIEKVRELRNHIAHGHSTLNLQKGAEPKLTISLPKDIDPFDPDTRHLEFPELLEALDLLNEATEVFRLLSRFGE